jgi:hypothetical protein
MMDGSLAGRWPLGSISDVRWIRVFSILSAGVLALQTLTAQLASAKSSTGR